MNCDQSRHYLDPLIDNELSIDLTAEMMQHLDSCLQCQDQWTGLTRLRATVLGAIERIEIPPGLVGRIKSRVDKSEGRRSRLSFRWLNPGSVAAAAAIVIVALVAFILLTTPKAKDSLVPNDLVADHRNAAAMGSMSVNPQRELRQLQQTLALEPVNLPGWKLVKVEQCQIDKLPAIHLCYANSKKQMLSCYQLKHGLFDAAGLKKHSMNGRIYCCGQLKDVSIVYRPSEKLDRILISAMPERELMSIAVKS